MIEKLNKIEKKLKKQKLDYTRDLGSLKNKYMKKHSKLYIKLENIKKEIFYLKGK
jgi:hypothetical protein